MKRFRDATGRSAPACPDTEGANGGDPAGCVSVEEAESYAMWLSTTTGKRYRLPSAVEWEYAAKAGHEGTARSGPGANAWGLVAMGGGVAELTADCWHERIFEGTMSRLPLVRVETCTTRILKDGGETEDARWQRASARRAIGTMKVSAAVGFRVMRELQGGSR